MEQWIYVSGKNFLFLVRSFSFLVAFCSWQVKIDGQDIRKVTLESLRKSIGVVPQDTVSCHKLCSLIFIVVPVKCVRWKQRFLCFSRSYSMILYFTISTMDGSLPLRRRSVKNFKFASISTFSCYIIWVSPVIKWNVSIRCTMLLGKLQSMTLLWNSPRSMLQWWENVDLRWVPFSPPIFSICVQEHVLVPLGLSFAPP